MCVTATVGVYICIICLTHVNVHESMKKPCSYMQFIKSHIFNPRPACATRVTVVVLCVCVCVSVFSVLPSHAFRHSTRRISGYSTEKTAKNKKPVSLKLLSSKVRSIINLQRLR